MRHRTCSGKSAKLAAIWVITTLILCSGLAYAEDLGYFQDTPEHADQCIEQILSSSLKPAVDESFTSLTVHLAAQILPFGQLMPTTLLPSANIFRFAPLSPSRLKTNLTLHELHSIYRI